MEFLYLRFRTSVVQRLVTHTDESATHLMSVGQRVRTYGTPEPVIGEQHSCPPGLLLVRDDGIYLMSNGLPRLDGGADGGSLVVYAMGFDPVAMKKNGHGIDAGIGVDDFVDFISLSDICCVLADKARTTPAPDVIIGVNETKLWLE